MSFLNRIRTKCTFLKYHKYESSLCKCSTVATQPKKSLQQQERPKKEFITDGRNLKDFLLTSNNSTQLIPPKAVNVPYLKNQDYNGNNRKVYFEVYGCQMNVNDTEIVWAILKSNGYSKTENLKEADVVLVVTCSIRENAENKVWHKLKMLRSLQNKRSNKRPKLKIGLLGCMAERLKDKVLEKEQSVDVIAGPDSYKDLPRLLAVTENNQKAVNVLLSLDETYADIMPVRLNENSVTAYISIMRGCDNMCTYCIVPFTRGRERSRPVNSIINEVQQLAENGVKEITLLGQNVNSYRDTSSTQDFHDLKPTNLARGFKTVYKSKIGGLRFADLLERVADVNPEIRIRFTSPHPKDFPDEVLKVIRSKNNICKSLHLPAQSGNSKVLERMRRGYTREAYLDLIWHVKEILPEVTISSDFICGFCGETEEEFGDTLSLMDVVRLDGVLGRNVLSVVLINRKIAELKGELEAEMPELQRFQKMDWQNLHSEEKLEVLLEVLGLKVTKSDRLLTNSGRLLTLQEDECLNLLEGLDTLLTTLKQIYYKEDESSKSSRDYSMREKTTAHRRFVDDVPLETKNDRLIRMSEVFRRHASSLNKNCIGKRQLILIEGTSKRSTQDLVGRNDGNIKVIIPDKRIPKDGELKKINPGDYVLVEINDANSQVLKGNPIHITSLSEHYNCY